MAQLCRTSRDRAVLRTIVAIALASVPAAARADVFAPPVPGGDFLYLGLPLGPIIGLAVIAATVVVFRLLRQRKVHGCLAVLAAGALFLVGDCTAYVVGLKESSRRKEEMRLRMKLEAPRPAPTPSSAVPATSASGRQ